MKGIHPSTVVGVSECSECWSYCAGSKDKMDKLKLKGPIKDSLIKDKILMDQAIKFIKGSSKIFETLF